MNEEEFKKQYNELVRKRMPKKRKVETCVELLWRLLKAKALDHKSAISTAKLSEGLKGVRGHLVDMVNVGLVRKKSNEPIRFFLDARDPRKPRYVRDPAQIRLVREANISELLRHIADNPRVAQFALTCVDVPSISNFSALIKKDDDLFSRITEKIMVAGHYNKEYKYGVMGWRTGSLFWYAADIVSVAS